MAKELEKQKSVKKVTPSRALSPFEEMELWFEEFFPKRWMQRWGMPSWEEFPRLMERNVPRVDVIDRDDEVVVRAEVPGVKKEDLDISVTENSVTIKGSTKREEEEEKGDYYRCEMVSGAFERVVGLPAAVDTDKTKASFEDGVLELKLPKISKAKRRRIKVS
ncbi:MAG: Hsp20/alpha crystallin family protein [Methylohalobius crimeensis]